MGNTSFLTSGTSSSPQSVSESIFQLENCSTIFMNSWTRAPRDLRRAGRVSEEAMVHLDHIVNEIMRSRDALKADNTYDGSSLQSQLDRLIGLSCAPVSRAQQLDIASCGPGNAELPSSGVPIKLEYLLNKIKHRRRNASNFRIDFSGAHIFIIAVDKPNQTPDSIVEFSVLEFCEYCDAVVSVI
ncbi:hypothetical protein L1D19_04995 [Vibrio natriegens]|uniref:hypothetical protein n=1 Tax=Vibrio natriegens TaxID=691 RepID=UPI001EFED7E7|nr:hypothetical protein [Vibrio natriegens]MCG9699487.1 hypothetical protein [Vibrio natriegens]